MTQPPNERPDPGQWTPPPAAPAPQWVPPSTPAPQPYGQQGQQPYGQQQPVWTPQPEPSAKPHRRAPLIASLVAVVALGGGGALTYVALSDSSSSGGATPKAAVQQVVQDMQNSDLVGLLDDLAPGERDALANPVREDVDKLKELHVLDPSANASKISGVTFRATGLTYGTKPIVVNDHVQIVQLTGGTIDVTGDSSNLPFTDQIRALQPTHPSANVHHQLNAQEPIRIATVKVGDRWYPSLFYTAADEAAGHRIPQASDAIPALGSASAEDAVRDEVNALLAGDLKTALAHISPAELGAVHDYGGMILERAPSWSSAGVDLTTLDLTTQPLAGGATRVELKKLVMSKDGEQIGITIDGSCATLTAQGQTKKLCASQVADQLSFFFGAFTTCSGGGGIDSNGNSYSDPDTCSGPKFGAAQKTALADLFSGFTKLGIATTQVDGKWYIDPVRTAADVFGTLLSGMKGNDILELTKLGH